jgi:dihydroorotase-like cyclic amidohydrolase
LSEILQSLAGAGPVFLFPQDGPLGEFEQAQAIAASKQTGASGQDIRDAMHPHYLADVGLRLMGAVSCLGRDPRLVAMPVTTSQEIAALAEIREMPRQNILAVAAMPYLVLGREDRSGAPPKGRLPAGYPPIRSQTDRLSLWQAAEAGLIDAIASGGAQDGDDVLGNPALFFSSLYGMGVIGRRIDLTTLITLLCDNPAKIMGVYPHKGSLQIGSDADVVIFDPNAKLDDLADDSPFKDINRRGKIHSVILNGKLGYSTENPVEEAPKGIIVSPEPVSLTK